MPSEIVVSNGDNLKVMAGVEEIRAALAAGDPVLETTRFAGFRGDEAVGGEKVVVNVHAIAYALDVPSP